MQTSFSTKNVGRQLKLEMLVFSSAGNLYASRTNCVASLADLPKDLEPARPQLAEWLSPRLFAALNGTSRNNQVFIFDLAQLLSSPVASENIATERNNERTSRVMLLDHPGVKIGLLVDEITEVRSIELNQLKAMPEFIEQVRQRKTPWTLWQTKAIAEVAPNEADEQMLMVVLDLPELFNEAEWVLLDNLNKAELETYY